jgi:hypothetical protein
MPADHRAEPAPRPPGRAMPSMHALLAAGAAAEAVCTPPADAPAGDRSGPEGAAPRPDSGERGDGSPPDQRDAA